MSNPKVYEVQKYDNNRYRQYAPLRTTLGAALDDYHAATRGVVDGTIYRLVNQATGRVIRTNRKSKSKTKQKAA
jgi:hypothetical protein